jgi:hypothetical protein
MVSALVRPYQRNRTALRLWRGVGWLAASAAARGQGTSARGGGAEPNASTKNTHAQSRPDKLRDHAPRIAKVL